METNRNIGIKMPVELIGRIDATCKLVYEDRTQFIKTACLERIENMANRQRPTLKSVLKDIFTEERDGKKRKPDGD